MALPTKTFTEIVDQQVQAIQGSSSTLFDFTTGSVLLALVEANADLGIWVQAIAAYVMSLPRFATSMGADADSWGAQFSFTRLPAVAAIVGCTFSRSSTTTATSIPVGTQVSNIGGTVVFQVVADSTNPAYSASSNSYTMAIGVSSLEVLCQCISTGTAGNVGIGSLVVIVTPLPGVQSVTNSAAASGGASAESDASFKSRFPLFLAGLARATQPAIEYALTTVQAGIIYNIVVNKDTSGNPDPGFFYVVVDDGTGSATDLPAAFVPACQNVVGAYRALGITYQVLARTLTDTAIVAVVTAAAGSDTAALDAAIVAAITEYVGQIGIGNTLYYTRLFDVIYNVSSDIVNVSSLTVNGGTSNITVDGLHAVRCVTAPDITVSI